MLSVFLPYSSASISFHVFLQFPKCREIRKTLSNFSENLKILLCAEKQGGAQYGARFFRIGSRGRYVLLLFLVLHSLQAN
jgi:hypothetical protein